MSYNYTQQNQPMYGMQNRPVYNSSNVWGGRIRPVSSLEEARAATIDFDGSIFFFPDLANKRIYTKQINLDGTCSLNMYELKELPVSGPEAGAAFDTSNFITRSEFENAIGQLKQFLSPAAEVVNETPQEQQAKPQFLF